jgi:hypothetical protein
MPSLRRIRGDHRMSQVENATPAKSGNIIWPSSRPTSAWMSTPICSWKSIRPCSRRYSMGSGWKTEA